MSNQEGRGGALGIWGRGTALIGGEALKEKFIADEMRKRRTNADLNGQADVLFLLHTQRREEAELPPLNPPRSVHPGFTFTKTRKKFFRKEANKTTPKQ